MGKNDDPQTGWMKERTGCSFHIDEFQQLSTIFIVSDVGVFKVVSVFWIIMHLRGES